jgi:hypothetical protein
MSIQYDKELLVNENFVLKANFSGIDQDIANATTLTMSFYAYEKQTGKPIFSEKLNIEQIRELYNHLNQISIITDSSKSTSGKFIETTDKNITIDNISEWFDETPDVCQDLLIKLLSSKWKISWQDLQNLIDRKEQFSLFKWIVENDSTIINGLKTKYWTSQTEKTIEHFLEDNSWILWLSLEAVQYNWIDETLKDLKKIQEQTPWRPEHNFDILTETTVLNIVELKLVDKKLFNSWIDSHWNPKWNPDFFEYVTQIQNYKRVLEQIWDSWILPPWKKIVFPNAYLIVWRLSDMDENQKKVFDMYRKNLKEPKIFTYDELLERAEKIANSYNANIEESIEEVPF